MFIHSDGVFRCVRDDELSRTVLQQRNCVSLYWHTGIFYPKFPSASFINYLHPFSSHCVNGHKIETPFTAGAFIAASPTLKMETLLRTMVSLTQWSIAKNVLNRAGREIQPLKHLYVVATGQVLAHSLDRALLLRFLL